MVSTKEVRKAIYAKLNVSGVTSQLAAGSASLFHSVAPAGSAFPMVVYNKQAGTSTHALGALAYDSHLWLVKGVVKGSPGPVSASVAEDLAAAIATALDFQTLTVTGGTNLYMARESDVDYTETDGDTQYRHSGGVYRIVVT